MHESGALFSPCRRYRYTLRRTWDAGLPVVMFVGLNPSTADEGTDDPTLRRFCGYARRWGFGGVLVVNLFAFRAADPRDLLAAADPIGAENDRWLAGSQAQADRVVVAWGNYGRYMGRAGFVLKMLESPWCLRINHTGEPAHPLYLPGHLSLIPYFVSP